ncbi:MAG: purine-nucleoside phosphorylase [Ruminococcaceae bacterium]|nr:purine-nucleoside phosphorylase [Oscillospiraceae bacterium]
MMELLNRAYAALKEKTSITPRLALVLGSGLGDFAENMDVRDIIPYDEIPGFPVSTVPGHSGRFLLGYLGDVPMIAMQGRVHYYEGYSMQQVVLPIRLMGMLGAKVLFLTNAAGGLQDGMQPGDLMLIEDHISSFVPSPLIGKNLDALGTRFPDMSCVYDKALREIILKTAGENGISLKRGIYTQLTGPQFETPTEIRMLKKLGADAVGMSTVCEAIAARHMGLRVCGISCISNLAAGLSANKLTHEEVQETANRVKDTFATIVKASISAFFEQNELAD